MTPHQKQYLLFLADKFVNLNVLQMKYFNSILKDKTMQKTGLSALELHTDMRQIIEAGKELII
jgi:hypothetical protein